VELCDRSFCHSFRPWAGTCRQMLTKRGRHGQGVTIWKLLKFGVDPEPDVDCGSRITFPLPLKLHRSGLCDIFLFSGGCCCASLYGAVVCETIQQPWGSLRCLSIPSLWFYSCYKYKIVCLWNYLIYTDCWVGCVTLFAISSLI